MSSCSSPATADLRWTQLTDHLRAAHAACDRAIADWCDAYRAGGGAIHCRAGCRECCSLTVAADFSEAWLLARHLNPAQRERLRRKGAELRAYLPRVHDLKGYLRLYRDHLGPCPFLEDDGCCGCYPVRPFSCRSLLSTRNRDWCGADIATLHPMEVQLFLASLDRRVVAYPAHYVAATQNWCRDAEAAATTRCRETFGLSLTGNLPWLVYLELEYGVGERFAQGYGSVAGLFAGEGLHHELAARLRSSAGGGEGDGHGANQPLAEKTEGSGGAA